MYDMHTPRNDNHTPFRCRIDSCEDEDEWFVQTVRIATKPAVGHGILHDDFHCPFFDMSASDNDGLWCSFEPDFKTTDIRLDCFLDEPTGELDEWYANQSDLHVQTVSIDPWTEEIRATPVVIDSGADISVMPLEFAFMGTNCSMAEDVVVQDASGNDMGKHGMREIELDVVDTHGNTVQFKDRFLISDVRQPILAVGKLLRRGWSIIHADQEPQLCNPDNTCRVSLSFSKNSLQVDAHVRVLKVCPVNLELGEFLQLGSGWTSELQEGWSVTTRTVIARLGHNSSSIGSSNISIPRIG